jgi:hypothetical protein
MRIFVIGAGSNDLKTGYVYVCEAAECLRMWQSRLTVCAVSGFTQSNPIGRKPAVPRHLRDRSESKLSPGELVGYGKTLLAANWADGSRDRKQSGN